MITAADLIRNRARLRMMDRINVDRAKLNTIKADMLMWRRKATKEEQRTIDLLTKRIEFCHTLRNTI